MPVAGPHEQQGTQDSRIDETPGLKKGPVITKIEAHPDANIVFGGELRQTQQLVDVSCRGFLDQHVDSCAYGGARNLDVRVLRRSNDDCLNIGTSQQLAPVIAGNAAWAQGRDVAGARQVHVDAVDKSRARQTLSPSLADRTTSNNTDVQSPSPQTIPRSPGTMRRKV